ncbi:MAG: type II secretion system F family protein [Actinomycetota bacterium]
MPRRRRGRWRSPQLTVDAVAQWCDQIARSVRSGHTLRAAVSIAPDDAALSAGTARLRHDLDRGCRLAVATAALAADQPTTERATAALRLVLSVLTAAADVGTVSSEPIDRVAAALRQQVADDQERSAQSAQARMSARVLTTLPIGTLAVLATVDPDVRAVVTAPHGALIVAIGGALNLAGWRWMRRIVRRRA